ncbi:MAG: hypothetical protein ACRBDL_11560 [Alphaproteobacteria bacterium]
MNDTSRIAEEFDTKAEYDLSFIPYRDGNEILWAVYDAKSDEERDGTDLLAKAISNEIGEKHTHISKERLDVLSASYEATLLFDSREENAVEKLQNLFSETEDVHEYLSHFGFSEDAIAGYSLVNEEESATAEQEAEQEETPTPETKKTPSTPSQSSKTDKSADKQDSSADEAEPETETAKEFNSVGSVPLGDEEEWENSDAIKLLWSALVFKQHEIDENIKGSVKELVSDALAIYTTATAATGYSSYAAASGLLAIGLMGYNAAQDTKDRDEILKDWANYIKNRQDPDVSREKAYDILKQDMKDSSFAYEGVSQRPIEEYKQYKPYFMKLAEYQGHLDTPDPLTADKVLSVGDKIRNIKPAAARVMGKNLLRAKHTASLTKDGLVEIGTDLKGLFNPTNGEKRKELLSNITNAGKVTSVDMKNWQKNRKTTDAEKKRLAETKKALQELVKETENDEVQTTPDTIHAKIDLVKYEQHRQIHEQIPGVRQDKKWAEINYANVSGSMSAQVAGIINGILTLNPLDILSNTYGLLTGVGAYAQTGSNVIKLDHKLHGQLVEEAEKHDYVKKMETARLAENYIAQHPEMAELQDQENHQEPG